MTDAEILAAIERHVLRDPLGRRQGRTGLATGPQPGQAWRVWLLAGRPDTTVVRVVGFRDEVVEIDVCGALAEIPTALGVRRVAWAETPEKGAGAG